MTELDIVGILVIAHIGLAAYCIMKGNHLWFCIFILFALAGGAIFENHDARDRLDAIEALIEGKSE